MSLKIRTVKSCVVSSHIRSLLHIYQNLLSRVVKNTYIHLFQLELYEILLIHEVVHQFIKGIQNHKIQQSKFYGILNRVYYGALISFALELNFSSS